MNPKKLVAFALLAILPLLTFAGGTGEELEQEGTPAGPPTCGESSFVVFGDPKAGGASLQIRSLSAGNKSDILMEQVNATGAGMAFITGDLYASEASSEEGWRKQAAKFLQEVAELKAQWYPVMGNHDAKGVGWGVTREMVFGGQSTYYSFDHNDSHFIILDAYMPGAWSSISEDQMTWLEDDLRTTTKPHIFVFVHPPLYPTGPHLGESLDTDIDVRDRLAALLTQYQVDAVFCGHEHFYSSFGYRELMQVTTGAGGAQPLKSYADFDDLIGEDEYGYSLDEITRWKAAKAFHYVVVEVKGNQVEIAAYDLEGYIIDQFSLTSERTLSPVT